MTVRVTNAPRPVDEAMDALLGGAVMLRDIESVPLGQARGRVLAADVPSLTDLPAWDNSAMDGYAFAHADLQADGGAALAISARYSAGACASELRGGTAARVFTGSPIPSGADTVAMQEDCVLRDGMLTVVNGVARGANIRRRAEELRAGERILPGGHRMQPQDVGLAASAGHACLPVYRRLRVALLCTGSELIAPGQALRPGKIYNSNQYLLETLAQGLGCEIVRSEQVRDSLTETVAALDRAVARADVVITSGGVSVGEEDHVKAAVALRGQMDWWRVAIKPGKPFAFGHVSGTPFLGLPGNPVSLFVTFCILVRPFLLRAQGVVDVHPRGVSLPAGFRQAATARRHYLGVRVHGSPGDASLKLSGPQGSGRVTSMTSAHGLAMVPENTGVQEGEPVTFLPFSELLT